MRQIGRCALLGALLLALTVPVSHAQFGVLAGANFEQAGDIKAAAADLNRDKTTGYHVGLFFEFGGKKLRFRPAAVFRHVGSYRLSDDPTAEEAAESFNVRVIEFPLDLRLNLLPSAALNPYGLGGPMLSVPRGEGEFGDAMNSWALSGNVGGGLGLSLGSIKLQTELRYQFGVTDYISDSFSVGGQTVEPSEKPQFSAFSVRLNLMF